VNIQKAVDGCILDLSLAKSTERTYRNGLNNFLHFLRKKYNLLPEMEADQLSIEHFIFFPAWLDKSYSKQTCGVYTAAARSFFDYLIISRSIQEPTHYDMLRYQQATKRSHKRREDRLPRFPNKDDVDRMLCAAHGMTEVSPLKERNIAILEFLASSGCRVSEVTALNVEDIDLEKRSTVVTGKGSKERRVFFSQSAANALVEYWKVRNSSMATDPAFGRHDKGAGRKRIKRMTPTTARRIVKNVAAIAGIDPSKFSPHYFRHAFAIRVLSETGNLALAQDLLGHTDPKSTRVYAKIHSEDLQRAHHDIFK
jgi:site-specific recombinase XerD